MGTEAEKTSDPLLIQEAYVNFLRVADRLEGGLGKLVRDVGLSPPQYNVLRILRGAGPEGLPCGSIGQRMINRVPDVTRLVDRLERSGLVERTRSEKDRRIVLQRITPRGLELLAGLEAPIRDLHRRQLGHLSVDELADLRRLLARTLEGPAESGASPETRSTAPAARDEKRPRPARRNEP